MYRKRYNYINQWPNSSVVFEVEEKYLEKINAVGIQNIFKPMTYDISSGVNENIAISFIIEAFDSLPENPNHAFEFFFRAYDNYSSFKEPSLNITTRIKKTAVDLKLSILSNNDIEDSFNKLFKLVPVSTCQYVYTRIFKEYDLSRDILNQEGDVGRILNRILDITGKGNSRAAKNLKLKEILEYARDRFGFDSINYPETIRKGSMLIYRIMSQEKIHFYDNNKTIIKTIDVDVGLKLNILLSGILYSMRNDSFHGANISSFKSSKASMKSYAHNHFCMLTQYIILNYITVNLTNAAVRTNFINNIEFNLNGIVQLYGRDLK